MSVHIFKSLMNTSSYTVVSELSFTVYVCVTVGPVATVGLVATLVVSVSTEYVNTIVVEREKVVKISVTLATKVSMISCEGPATTVVRLIEVTVDIGMVTRLVCQT
jgi:hypothetical protein